MPFCLDHCSHLLSGCHPSSQVLTVHSPHTVRGTLPEPRSDHAKLLRTLWGSRGLQRKALSKDSSSHAALTTLSSSSPSHMPGNVPASRPLHLLFPLPGMCFLQLSALPNPSCLLSLSSNICSARPAPALLPHVELYLSEVRHPLPRCIFLLSSDC